jgi:2-dehydro-3-deoxyphosphogluconate aldolase / (4S)-4-hydroxy-2-oxoglutarate aldolase
MLGKSGYNSLAMTIDETVRRMHEIGIIPVVRAASVDEARRAVEAICSGGIPIIEITMTVPDAVRIIRQLTHHYGAEALVGAGTVTNSEQAKMCLDGGAEFLVSPGLSLPVLRAAASQEKLAIPGALTPTEVMAAVDAGATLIKVFPCGSVGGPKYLKSLRAPFPQLRFIPTGGVNLSNAAEYIAAGAFALGVGADLVDVAAIRNNQHHKIVETACALIAAVRAARETQHAKVSA